VLAGGSTVKRGRGKYMHCDGLRIRCNLRRFLDLLTEPR
jgi:hypothetical protein